MKLTLGQAAKEVGLSKTAISNAIKNGRLSAEKLEGGSYAIDPAELFRVYPPSGKVNSNSLQHSTPSVDGNKGVNDAVNTAHVNGLQTLLEEKDKQIRRLIDDKEKTEELLDKQTKQAERITLLLEHKSKDGAGEWEQSIKSLEARVSNQDDLLKEKESKLKVMEENAKLKRILTRYKMAQESKEAQPKSLFQKLFGTS